MQKKTMGVLTLGAASLVVASVLMTLRNAHADGVPGIIPVQGCVTDAMGKELDGLYQIEFRLYGVANAALNDALVTKSKSVTFRGCVFSDSIQVDDLSVFEKHAALFLGIKIAGDAELIPRFEVGAAPYAVQARHADRASRSDNGVPPGTIVAFASEANPPPDGWVYCNGQQLDGSKPEFAALFAAIGEIWGEANDGIGGKFNVPDLRGRFLRGTDDGTNRDPDASNREASLPGGNKGSHVGTVQSDALGKHDHGIYAWSNSSGGCGARTQLGLYCGGQQIVLGDQRTTVVGESQESRPKNASVMYIIKL